MGEVHQLIFDKGVEQARLEVSSKHERVCLDTAFQVLADDRFELSILHSGFSMTALPHRRVDNLIWERFGGTVESQIKLHVESGFDENKTPYGLPYGPAARLILIYLSTEAVRNKSRVVELGQNMNQFLTRMGMSIGGKTFLSVREQSKRLSTCRLTFFSKNEKETVITNGAFVRTALLTERSPGERSSWNDCVELEETFYNSLLNHPLPLREAAIRELSSRSSAMDYYCWLAYRLHYIDRPTFVSWSSLHNQFGGGIKERWLFVRGAREPLELALAAYPEAKVDMTEGGLMLHPSPSPVPKEHPWSKKAIV